jgi:hypothetical protein
MKEYRARIILLALGLYLLKVMNYYYANDDVIHTNHTIQDELSELGVGIAV